MIESVNDGGFGEGLGRMTMVVIWWVVERERKLLGQEWGNQIFV